MAAADGGDGTRAFRRPPTGCLCTSARGTRTAQDRLQAAQKLSRRRDDISSLFLDDLGASAAGADRDPLEGKAAAVRHDALFSGLPTPTATTGLGGRKRAPRKSAFDFSDAATRPDVEFMNAMVKACAGLAETREVSGSQPHACRPSRRPS